MGEFVLPMAVAAFAWWFSTGAILWLDGLPARTFRWSMLGASAAAAIGVVALAQTAWSMDAAAAYVAFFAALAIWAWHEMAFLMGLITGPRRTPCPPGARGWARLRYATEAVLHHELALALTAAALLALTWGAPNQTGAATFLVLFVLRVSAKLNLFLGAPHVTDEFIPEHLAYLKSYFRRAPPTVFFAASLVAIAGLCAVLAAAALSAPPGGGLAVGAALVFALTALGLFEHVALVTPMPDAALWRWALAPTRSKR